MVRFAGEPAGRSDVQDHLACPRLLVGITIPQPLMGLSVLAVRPNREKFSSPAEVVTDDAIRIHTIGVDTLRSRDALALAPAS